MTGLAPQLLLEAAMAAEGGFGAGPAGVSRGADLLAPVRRPGCRQGDAAVQETNSGRSPDAVRDAKDRLCDLIDAFDQPERAYLSRPHPGLAPRFSDYEQLARVAEWSAAGDGDE